MHTNHHVRDSSYLAQEYKTKTIPNNIILSKSRYDSIST